MATQTPNSPKMRAAGPKPPRPLRLPVFFSFLVAAVVTVLVLLLVFPNLSGHAGFLALVVLTTLFSFASMGLTFSGLRARLSVAARWLVSIFLWAFVTLDVIFLVLPLFISGPAANDNDPFAVGAKPTNQAISTTALAKTSEAVVMVKTTEAATPTTIAPTPTPIQTTASAPTQTTKAVQPTQSLPTTVTTASLLAGEFNNQGVEPVAGKALLGKSADGKIVLRLENLKSAPGPDLFVYLTKNASPDTAQVQKGFEVGKLKATSGNLNYELDSSLDLSQYKAVVVYCKSFSTIFGFANLK